MIDRLVIVNDVSIARGGATSIALESIRALRARNIPVTMIVGDGGGNPEIEALGVEIVALGQALLLDAGRSKSLVRGLYNPRTTQVIGEWIGRHDTPGTIYHVHTWTKILSPSLFAALRAVTSRLIISAHDFFLVCPNGGYVFYNTGETCSLRPMSMACIAANCDRRSYPQKLWRVARQASQSAFLDFRSQPPLVLAVHDGMREGLARGGVPHDTIRVLRNPVRAFSQTRVQAEKNREALFIGRLNDEKGADLAAEAAERANVRLRIIGDGPMLETIQRNYPKAIIEGRRSHAQIGSLIQQARVVIVSSRYPEPFGLVAVEAMWSGVPVIINASALLSADIVACDAGTTFDQQDPPSLTRVLRELLDDDNSVERMSRNAFTRTCDLALTHDDWGEKLARIYESRIAQAR